MDVWYLPACFYSCCSSVWRCISSSAGGAGSPSDWSRCTSAQFWPPDLRGRSRGPACRSDTTSSMSGGAILLLHALWPCSKIFGQRRKRKCQLSFIVCWPCLMRSLWLGKLRDQYIFNLLKSCEKKKNKSSYQLSLEYRYWSSVGI